MAGIGQDTPAPPAGAEWRRAIELEEGDLVDGTIVARITELERKPKTVWITLEPADPEDPRLLSLGPLFGHEPQLRIRPRHEDLIAVPTDSDRP